MRKLFVGFVFYPVKSQTQDLANKYYHKLVKACHSSFF